MNMNFINTPSLSKKQKPSNKKAFALVLSLALMGFMVLLIVTLATMVQMQMRLSRQAMIDFKAKQAAKFAAYQAMSRVQSALGPDTRITANATMFDPIISESITALEKDKKYEWWASPMDIERDEAERIDDNAISQNRYWVGVWDARRGYHPKLQLREQARSEYVTNTVEKAVTWLVSGNIVRSTKLGSDVPAKYLPTSQLEDGSYARLVSGGSASDSQGARAPQQDVLAPLVKLDVDPNPVTGDTITDGKETRIAWWVADENQKASLNAVASKEAIQHAERIDYRAQSLPFYSGIHGVTIPGGSGRAGPNAFDFDFNDGDDTSSISRIRNLSDVSQLDIFRSGSIPETQQLSKMFFHSASFDTKGLLVNVRDGGLKKDLSLGLTRKDFGNETEIVGDKDNNNKPEYFERPYGVAGYDYKTTAYPLQHDRLHQYNFDPQKAGQTYRILKGKGHMFGPQMYGNEFISDPDGKSAIKRLMEMFDDEFIAKDSGGPLWDQLRSYYNLRAEDLAERATLNERVQTDDRFGLKPVVKRFQVSGGCYGNKKEMQRCISEIESLEDTLSQMYSVRLGVAKEDIKALYFDNEDHWLTADEALNLGFIDAIYDADPVPVDSTPEQIYTIFNNRLEKPQKFNQMNLDELKKRPCFKDCATDDDAYKVIGNLETEAGKVSGLEKENAQLKDEIKAYKDKAEADAANERKALLDAVEEDGRIDAGTRSIYENMLKEHPEDGKKALKALAPKRKVLNDLKVTPGNESPWEMRQREIRENRNKRK